MITIYGIDESGISITLWQSDESTPANFNHRKVILEAARKYPELVDFSVQKTCNVCDGTGLYASSVFGNVRTCGGCQGEGQRPANDLANGSML